MEEIDSYVTIAKASGRDGFIKQLDHLFLVRAPVEATQKSSDGTPTPMAGTRTRTEKIDPTRLDAAAETGQPPRWRVAKVKRREATQLVVGRVASCDVYLAFPSVSKRHAVFKAAGSSLDLYDEGSTNGTWVNGEQLAQGKPMPVKVGDKLRFGGVEVQLLDAGRFYDLLLGIK